MRHARWTALLLAVVLAGPSASTPVSAQQVTKYQARLQAHVDALAGTKAELDRLRAAPTPASAVELDKRKQDIRAAGSRLLTEGQAFQATVKEFLAGQTRRGLDVEIEAVHKGAATLSEQLVTYRQLTGTKVAPRTGSDAGAVESGTRELLAEGIAARIDDHLVATGVREILRADSWNEIRKKAQTSVKEEVNRAIERETKKYLGLAFHDRRSMERAVTLTVNREINRQVTNLLVQLGAGQLVVALAGTILVKWVADAFWNKVLPAVKEAFRGKGKLEGRVTQSIETLKAAQKALNALPNDATRTAVVAALNGAVRATTATNYLQNDLKKAGRSDLLVNLGGALEDLARTTRITWTRFLLNKEDAVRQLSADQKVVADALDELKGLVGKTPTCVAPPSDYEIVVSDRKVEVSPANANQKMYSWTVTYRNKGKETLYVLALDTSDYANGQPTHRIWQGTSPEAPNSRLAPGQTSGPRHATFTQYPNPSYHYTFGYDEKVLFLYDRPDCYADPVTFEAQAALVPNPLPSKPS